MNRMSIPIDALRVLRCVALLVETGEQAEPDDVVGMLVERYGLTHDQARGILEDAIEDGWIEEN